ncbi:MAG: hypothetical protein BWZ10_00506 [candidate division BRC1 bacterium ADurb.BinA364]|nr:MAG: hypothetical protein BWZ10_00506 [candidate division BRC1 bacterium ADurb.BinA364]
MEPLQKGVGDQRADGQQPVDAPFAKKPVGLFPGLKFAGADFDGNAVVLRAGDVENARERFAEVAVAEHMVHFGHDDGDDARAVGSQGPGHGVRPVAHLLDQRQNALFGFVVDSRRIVDGQRDGGAGNSSHAGNVANGDFLFAVHTHSPPQNARGYRMIGGNPKSIGFSSRLSIACASAILRRTSPDSTWGSDGAS